MGCALAGGFERFSLRASRRAGRSQVMRNDVRRQEGQREDAIILRSAGLVIVWLMCVVAIGNAQARPSVALHVLITDTLRQPVGNTRVIVSSQDSNARTEDRMTDEAGWAVLELAPGNYSIRVLAIGFEPETRTVTIGNDLPDTLSFQIKIAREILQRLEETRLLADTSQPRLHLEQGKLYSATPCYGVDSIIVNSGVLTVTGYRASPVTPAGVFGNIFRHGHVLVLDIFNADVREVGMAIHCVRWRAVISNLPAGRLSLTVRHMGDPRAQGRTSHLLSRWFDSRDTLRIAVAPP